MVYINGNDILSAYTSGISVSEIFTQGVQVWPVLPSTSYYIRWTPSDLTGTFSIGGYRYYFEDYNGYFSNFDGTIPESAFEGTGVTMIETNAVSFGSSAFANCSSLVSAYLSNCSEIVNDGLFYSCTSLRTVSLPICTSIGSATFTDCPELSIVNLPQCRVLGSRAFYIRNGYKPLSISCPVCERYQDACFQGRYLIRTSEMDFTSCKYIGKGAFYDAIGLYVSSIRPVYDFPNCSYIGRDAFYNCGMSFIKLSNVTHIYSQAFYYDARHWGWPQESDSMPYRYISIYTSTVCSIANSKVFEKFNGSSFVQGAEIYVPSSLYSEYLSAQYWSDISTHIHKITS